MLGPVGDPGVALELIERERVTHCALTPAVARQWLGARAARPGHDLSSLRVPQVGGARLGEDTAARLAEVFACRVQQVYGMSEGLLNLTRLDDPPRAVAAAQGRPASPGDETRVVDGEGRPVADGETGELLVRGPGVITAYHGGAEPDAFTPDGFLRTSDLALRGCRHPPARPAPGWHATPGGGLLPVRLRAAPHRHEGTEPFPAASPKARMSVGPGRDQ